MEEPSVGGTVAAGKRILLVLGKPAASAHPTAAPPNHPPFAVTPFASAFPTVAGLQPATNACLAACLAWRDGAAESIRRAHRRVVVPQQGTALPATVTLALPVKPLLSAQRRCSSHRELESREGLPVRKNCRCGQSRTGPFAVPRATLPHRQDRRRTTTEIRGYYSDSTSQVG